MKVFISWSGPRSETIAKALREWLPLVLNYVEPWVSQSDIEAGERWGIEVAKELEASNFGVICVTQENLSSPWLLFEAGALAKSMEEGRVIPLLLDLDFKDISGPLAQFQAKKAEQAGIKEIVFSLNKVATAPIPDQRLEKLFAALWGELDTNISSIPKGKTTSRSSRPQGEILEELVSSVRGVEMRLRDTIDEDPNWRRSRRTRIHPMMLMDISRHFGEGPGDPISILVLASQFRDGAPWVYEIALEAYRAMMAGRGVGALHAYQKLVRGIEVLRSSPIGEELGIDRKLLHVALEWFREFEIHGIGRFDSDRQRRKVRQSPTPSEVDNG